MLKALKFGALALLLTSGVSAQVSPASSAIMPWKDGDPYRNFLGTWRGTIPINPSGTATPVLLTISEDGATATMVWHYSFGVPGQKHYEEDDKRVVLSPTDGRMMMHWVKEPKQLYEVSDLPSFQKAGYGTFVAVTRFDERNYWKVKRSVTSRLTVELQPDTLVYFWEVTRGGKTSIYPRLEFTRSPGSAPPPSQP